GDIEAPADLRFSAAGLDFVPCVAVPQVGDNAEAVDDGHSASQLRSCLNLDEVHGGRIAEFGMQEDSHGDWVRQRDAMFAGLDVIGLRCSAVAADGELCARRIES